jgi:hypothetical protein
MNGQGIESGENIRPSGYVSDAELTILHNKIKEAQGVCLILKQS